MLLGLSRFAQEQGLPQEELLFAKREVLSQKRDLNEGSDDEGVLDEEEAFLDHVTNNSQLISNFSHAGRGPDLPGVFTYLPHIKGKPEAMLPHMNLSIGRTGVQYTIGIPTIRRPKGIYVYKTVKSLVDAMTEDERQQVVILVLIAEPWNQTFCRDMILNFTRKFAKYIADGTLEVFCPKPDFYPDLSRVKLTLGDPADRVIWRSKQNLDYAYMMLHAWKRGHYYIQLEDDIKASVGFVSHMTAAVNKQHDDWMVLQLSQLGFIGRLFHSKDVPKIMEFLLMFYTAKPCDWLLDDFLQVQSCGHGEKWNKCVEKIRKISVLIKPALFQHQGLHSSFKGTVNKLKDKNFSPELSEAIINGNPPIKHIISTMEHYKSYNIENVYRGNGIFWAKAPETGDLIDFLFDPPVVMTSIELWSGDTLRPNDKFYNTTIEVLPAILEPALPSIVHYNISKNMPKKQTKKRQFACEERAKQLNVTKENLKNTFYNVGHFDSTGYANATVPHRLYTIQVVRLHVHSDLKNWVILNKVIMRTKS